MIIIKATSSSSILPGLQYDAGYPAKKAFFVSAVFFAIDLKNTEDKIYSSMIAMKNLSIRNFFLLLLLGCQSFLPHGFLQSFSFLKAQSGQIAKSQKHQKHVAVPPTNPRPSFVVIQPQFLFELFISLFYPDSFVKETNDLQDGHILRHIAEAVSKFKLAFALPVPFDDQPKFFVDESFSVSLGRPDLPRHRFYHQGLPSTIAAQLQMLPGILLDAVAKLRDFDRRRIRLYQSRTLLGVFLAPVSFLEVPQRWDSCKYGEIQDLPGDEKANVRAYAGMKTILGDKRKALRGWMD
ncbi:MAG: hypothetical protein JRI41_10530 [Deltaproteobacteria bacterium]|nr:hypothetical protein [Deltaproteobacteria bacterium]